MKLPRSLLLSSCFMAGAISASSSTQDEFVARMEAAMAGKKREARLTSKLMEMAQPVERPEVPRFLEEDYQDFGINITEYALRYIGCQNVHQYSDDLAEDEDSTTVLGMNRFVIVRLCPQDKCSNYHHYGCNSGFGDYLIPMEDYLQTMAEDYFQEYQNYCETCYYCMVQSASQQQQGDDAAQYNASDDAVQYYGDDANNNGGRRLGYSTYNSNNTDDYYYMNADFYNNMDDDGNNGDNCANYYNACEDFRKACKDYSQYATNMETYFECAEFDVGNYVGYLGPHCRSDGKTIGIGVYKDQYCNEYNSDMLDISNMMGMDLGDDNLRAYYSEQCISCLAADGYDLDQNDDGQVTSVCSSLYEMSAKCNVHMGDDGDYSSYNQEDTSDEVCTFIHNLITNSYDEYGHIYLDNDGIMSYVPDISSMTKFQKYAMSFSTLLVIGLFGYACYLHRKISSSKYAWYPKGRNGFAPRGLPGQAVKMERMHSGIIQGRSRSGGGPELHEGAVFA